MYLDCFSSAITEASKLVQIVYHSACTLSKIIEQWNEYQDIQALSNMGAVHSDKHIHRIKKDGW